MAARRRAASGAFEVRNQALFAGACARELDGAAREASRDSLSGMDYAAGGKSSMLTRSMNCFPRLPRRRCVGSLVACLGMMMVVAHPRAAAAATAKIVLASLPRLDASGKEIAKRGVNQEPEGISLQDCLDDQRIAVPMQLAGYEPQSGVEIWASSRSEGRNCTNVQDRTGATKVCWRVDEGIALEPNPRPLLRVRKILAGLRTNSGGSSTAAGTPQSPDDSVNICGGVDLSLFRLNVLYFAPGSTQDPAALAQVDLTADTVGPAAPSGLSVLPGNQRIRIAFANVGDGGLSQFLSVKAYCAPAERGAKASEAQGASSSQCADAGDDAGDTGVDCTDASATGSTSSTADAGVATAAQCTSSAFFDATGKPVTPNAEFNQRYECGSTAGSTVLAESLRGSPLANLTEYAVAVAAVDRFGNVGALSPVYCETPEPTEDFWQAYRAAGGQAGGGVCSAHGAGMPVGSLSGLGIVAVAAMGAAQRRWRRRANSLQSASSCSAEKGSRQ